MPQASKELREEWGVVCDDGGIYYLDTCAVNYLRDAGYKLNSRYQWIKPEGHKPTAYEMRAIRYLIEEWDFDGLVS